MPSKSKLLMPILGGVLILLVVLMVVASQQEGPTFTPPVPPQNNGYDQLLEAAKLLAPRTGFYDEMDDQELAKIVEQNRQVLELVDTALKQPIMVPVDWSAKPGSAGSLRLNDWTATRSIARALAAQARWQRLNGEHRAALDSAGKIYQLGANCARGGLLNDYLVGLAVLGLGLDELRRLDPTDSKAMEAALETVASHREDLEHAYDVIEREKAYIRANASGFVCWQMRRNLDSMFDASAQGGFAAERRLAAQQNLLWLHLALHLYHLEQGAWPTSLDDLPTVRQPQSLLDPFSNQPFVYRLTADSYQLYSVGENSIDDGGQTDEYGLQP
ncbi:MAG: hypothetical protein AAGD11_21065, partial [Planctomycetota bacterium]